MVRLVHLSDVHLGFRQYQRLTPAGQNQREVDVAGTFTRAIDKVIAIAPELVLVGGDFFHTARPTNPAILHGFAQMGRLRLALPDAVIVVVAGNHDLPRTTESRCILRLFEQLGVHVADAAPRRLRFEQHGLAILAVPEMPGSAVELTPDLEMPRNVLLAHGEVDGLIPARAAGDEAATLLPMSAISHPRWDYVALGHYHVYKQVTPRAYYSGSLDYVSASMWEERHDELSRKLPGKGLIEWDLDTGKQRFHPIAPARPLIDLPPVEARGLSAPDLNAAIASAVERIPGGVDGKIVRLLVRDVPRHVVRELDYKALREWQRRALHFHLDTRKPEMVRAREASGAPGRRPSLADMLRESLRSRLLTSDIDRDALVELGLHYLREAEQAGVVRDAPAAAEEQ